MVNIFGFLFLLILPICLIVSFIKPAIFNIRANDAPKAPKTITKQNFLFGWLFAWAFSFIGFIVLSPKTDSDKNSSVQAPLRLPNKTVSEPIKNAVDDPNDDPKMKDIKSRCNIAACNAGTNVKTVFKKGDFFYKCPNKAISEYVEFTFGIIAMSYELSGQMPNISPETGEPEQEGETKMMLDNYRQKSGVRTFDEAVSMCKKGKNGVIVKVANNPNDIGSGSFWVFDNKSHESFWMPKGSAKIIN